MLGFGVVDVVCVVVKLGVEEKCRCVGKLRKGW